MALYVLRKDFSDERPRSGPQHATGYLFSVTMVLVIVIVALALVKAVAGPDSHSSSGGPTTVEATMTPAPVSEPVPVTERRPAQAPM